MTNSLSRSVAALLVTSLIVSIGPFIVPRAHAGGMPVIDVANLIKNAITSAETKISAVANLAQKVNTYVLQPLAFAMSGNLLQMLTTKTVNFVSGKTNGTGRPSFVQDLSKHKQSVSDIQANLFLVQYGKNSNSPFRSAIQSQLRRNYLQNTSLAGFFARNRSTLYSASPNIDRFLAGDFSQGGTRAWLALTTQAQNNPYTSYYEAQDKMNAMVSDAVDNRLEELKWNQGFLSWCGPSEPADDTTQLNDLKAIAENPSPKTVDEVQVTATRMGAAKAGDPCGPGKEIKTPGSVIKAALDKALGTNQDKLANMGSTGNEVKSILSNLGKIVGTVSFAQSLMDTANPKGLAGAGQDSSAGPSPLDAFSNQRGFLGSNVNDVLTNAPKDSTQPTLADIEARLSPYESAWTEIRVKALSAQSAVADLLTCANTSTQAAAQTANAEITGTVSKADAATAAVTAARTQVSAIRTMQNSDVDPGSSTYLNAIQTLQNMPPTETDVYSAVNEAQLSSTASQQGVSGEVSSGASAEPQGSLNVIGGTIADRMELFATNAKALKLTACGT